MPQTTPSQPATLLDDVRNLLRPQYYSIHTERSYVEWIVRLVRFHTMRSREDLFPAEPKIEAFLTDLAVHGQVAASTENQAMHALVFLYKRALKQELPDRINAVRARQKINVPVVMPREEVATVLALMEGTAQLVAKLPTPTQPGRAEGSAAALTSGGMRQEGRGDAGGGKGRLFCLYSHCRTQCGQSRALSRTPGP